jgi:hypothetical protein
VSIDSGGKPHALHALRDVLSNARLNTVRRAGFQLTKRANRS